MTPVKVRNIVIGEGMPKICVPIVGVTKEDIIAEAKSFDAIPVDVVEWRVDWFENVFDTEAVKDVLKELRESCSISILTSCAFSIISLIVSPPRPITSLI